MSDVLRIEMRGGGADFSEDRVFRYGLWRHWGPHTSVLTVIGNNPSKADEQLNDPTSRKCIGFAKRWGFGGLFLANANAYCATDPRVMLAAPDPVGPRNDEAIASAMRFGDKVVVAWGVHGAPRAARIAEIAKEVGCDLWCFGTTKNGQPFHPLYQPYGRELVRWRGP